MRYELDILAAITRLPKPTTQEIVSATKISERKVQTVIKTLQTDLCMGIKRVKDGRKAYFVISEWGAFESGERLKDLLVNRKIEKTNNNTHVVAGISEKHSFYESVKMKNYTESTRLEGLSVSIHDMPMDKQSLTIAKRNLIAKYSKYKGTSKNHG